MSASPLTATPVARFAQGEDVTVLGTGKADPAYCGNVPISLGVRLPGGRMLVAGPQWPGVILIHGDIMPTLLHALEDALRVRDCPEAECVAWHDQYEALLDALGAGE